MDDDSNEDPTAEQGDLRLWLADDTESHPVSRELERALARAALFEDHAPPRIGRFSVIQQLGTGASSVVYAAWDELLARRVAVKIFVAESFATRRQVQREARALAQLSHRNVVAVYDAGEWNHHAFIAMELIAGTTLASWQADPERTTAELLDAYLQAGQGLAAAHQAGLVHRDFKPANVMVASDGRVVVTDFGLVRDVAADAAQAGALAGNLATGEATTRRSVVGTPAYIAPEQRRGQAPHPSADIYSFSMALCEALIGWHPLRRTEQAWQSALATRVPSRIRAAIRTGLSVDPAARGATIAPLLEALRPSLRPSLRSSLQPHDARDAAATPWHNALMLPPRARRVVRAGLPIAGLATILTLLYREQHRGHDVQPPPPAPPPLPIFQAVPHRLLVDRIDTMSAASSSRDDARGATEVRSLLLQPLPTEVRCAWPAPIVPVMLGDDYATGRDDHGRVYVCALDTGEISLAVSDARCVVPGNHRSLGVIDTAGHTYVVQADRGHWRRVPADGTWSPSLTQPDSVTRCGFRIVLDLDGKPRITYLPYSELLVRTERLTMAMSNTGVDVIDVIDRSGPTLLTTLTIPPPQAITRMEVSRDESRALVVRMRGPLYWWEAGHPAWHAEPLHSEAGVIRAHLSPSGRRAVLVDLLGRLEVRTLGGGRTMWLSLAGIKDAMFRDDDTVIGLDGDQRIWRWDLANQRSGIAAIHEKSVWSVVLNAQVMVSGSEDGTATVIDRASGAARLQLRTNNQIFKVRLDGDRLVTAGDDGLHLWDWHDGSPLPIAQGHGLRIWDVLPAATPGGARFYLTGALRSGEISVWQGGVRIPIYRTGSGARVDKIAISADGRTAAVVNSHGTLIVIDLAAQRVIAAKTAHAATWCRGVAFDPATATIVTAGDDGWLRTWSALDLAPLGQVRASSGEIYDLDVQSGRALTAAADGVTLIDLTVAQIVRRYRAHTTEVFTARFRADGRWFVTGEQSGRACLWRLEDDTCHTWLDGHTKGVVNAVFADDGTIFTSSHDGTVRYWRPTYDLPLDALLTELARYGSRP